jgi:alcohol dehydrogenase YqhD (iron-dependent ADH family)
MDSASRAVRHPDDLDARSNLSWAATLASTVAHAGRGGMAPLRSMAYPLTARHGIDHGHALSALWPSFMRYALGNRVRLPQIGRYKRYALLGRQIFGVHDTDDEVAAEITSYRLASWLRGMEMPVDLLGFNLDPDSFADLAAQVVSVSGDGRRLPGGLSGEDVQNIYEGALRVHR